MAGRSGKVAPSLSSLLMGRSALVPRRGSADERSARAASGVKEQAGVAELVPEVAAALARGYIWHEFGDSCAFLKATRRAR